MKTSNKVACLIIALVLIVSGCYSLTYGISNTLWNFWIQGGVFFLMGVGLWFLVLRE